MKSELFIIFTAILGLLVKADNTCTKNGKVGTYKNFYDCPPAVQDFTIYKKPPQILRMEGGKPIVCCIERIKYSTSHQPDESGEKNKVQTPECPPIAKNRTAEKTGQKAWDKCIEYQEKLIFPCTSSSTPSGGSVRLDLCNWKPDSLIINGDDAYEGEFPHMVLLGFGNMTKEDPWGCGGILVSERFILTAGHCTFSRQLGAVTDAKVGILERNAPVDSTKHYKIKRVIKHPDYKPPGKYNDIALLETDREIALDVNAIPACLYNGHQINDSSAVVIGWGTTEYRQSRFPTVLQKVTLEKFSDEVCSVSYAPGTPGSRYMKEGYDARTQICYGDWHKAKDSCNGDSGGPAQVKHPKIYCMYSILGITSWGRQCGYPGQPAIYTRIEAYVPWIESIVWP